MKAIRTFAKLITLAVVILVVLKLLRVIDLSWVFIFSPIWGSGLLFVLLFALARFIGGDFEYYKNSESFRDHNLN